MDNLKRELTVFADGVPFGNGCRKALSGTAETGLFPGLFLLKCWNLSEAEIFRLMNTKELSVLRGDSCLACGKVSDVFRETVPEGTVTTAAFSLGLNLWESRVSLSLSAGKTVSETVEAILNASGTGISLLSFPGEDPVFPRGQAFHGRAAECVASALSAARAQGVLVQAGLCVIPKDPLPASLHLTEKDLTDIPAMAENGKKLILSTTVTGFRPGEDMTLEYKGKEWKGRILKRFTQADTGAGPWHTQLLIDLSS